MRWLGLFVSIALLLTSIAASASDESRALSAQAAFQDWLDTAGLKGTLALRSGGREVAVFEMGLPVDAPAELASASKMITALCAQQLVARGVMTWSDKLEELPGLTAQQYVTHTSGLREDSTQALMLQDYAKLGPHRAGDILDRVLARSGPEQEPGAFHYNNENYALLGLMIERAAGQPYQDICAQLVLAPIGVRGGSSQIVATALPWGGGR